MAAHAAKGIVLKQKILVTGAGGQLGRELVLSQPCDVDCVAVSRSELDIGDSAAVYRLLSEVRPALVINAAAYTAVDRAESDAEAAWQANALGPGYLATACKAQGARMIHLSTDFVFNGEATEPYKPDSPTSPVSEYGRGKLVGEQAVTDVEPNTLIVRTSWVYSRFSANFVKTMLRLMSERDELGVVADQRGTPTWARGLAQALWVAATKPALSGIYNWSDEGECTWCDFAQAIYEEGRDIGLLDHDVLIKPIPASSYPTPAHRPSYSVLDRTSTWRDFEIVGQPWRTQLRSMLLDMKDHLDE
ncbi:MAG: dTDP-4-dehydrorhamnose reductase [Halioglobus sp.]